MVSGWSEKFLMQMRDPSFMQMIPLFLYCLLFHEGLATSREYAYHQITDLCNHKTKAITVPILNLAFILLHLFEGTNKTFK